MYPWLRLAKFYHTSIVGILDCSWSLWYYVCWIFPSLAHITYWVPKWRCNITEISRLHQLCHDNVQISWYHITTSHFESFFGARLTKTQASDKQQLNHIVDKTQLLTATWSIHGFYATNNDDFHIRECWSMIWPTKKWWQCLECKEIWPKDGSLWSKMWLH